MSTCEARDFSIKGNPVREDWRGKSKKKKKALDETAKNRQNEESRKDKALGPPPNQFEGTGKGKKHAVVCPPSTAPG